MNKKNLEDVVILGVDPGTIVTGYGVVSLKKNTFSLLDFGCIRPPAKYKLSDRYLIIYEALLELCSRFNPDDVAIEMQYVKKNVQSAMKLGIARGVVIIAAKQAKKRVFEYAPSKAKLAVTGSGNASKPQVQGMVQRLFLLEQPPSPEDAADALAIAVCHGHALQTANALSLEI